MMSSSWIYLMTFLITLFALFYVLVNSEKFSTCQVIILAVMSVGNGGYYALAKSHNLEEAILANKLTYVIGIFAPMLLLFLVCEVCRITINKKVRIFMWGIQMLLYLCVCSIGKYDIYYKTVSFHQSNGLSFITKTYGPVHNLYIVSMFFYFGAVIRVAARAKRRKNQVSSRDVASILILEFIAISWYLLERLVNLNFEVFPLADTIMMIYMLYPISKMRLYSVEGNFELVNKKIHSSGYIMLDKKLRYMGCNELAAEIFPELLKWELEKKVPGSGGGFNTFLRLPLMAYIESGKKDELLGREFSIKGKKYFYSINTIKKNSNKVKGYMIEIAVATDFSETVTAPSIK